jgi:hypothetical protein
VDYWGFCVYVRGGRAVRVRTCMSVESGVVLVVNLGQGRVYRLPFFISHFLCIPI